MNKDVKAYVHDLFRGYEETPALHDFKEEIISNLEERIADLKKSGLSEKDAFTKAIAELGDITSIADEISRQKRKEIIGRMYTQAKPKLTIKHVLGYVAAGAAAIFGIITAFMTYFVTGSTYIGVATIIPFIIPACAAFVFLGLTQETIRKLPMSWKRALVYALSVGVILFGLVSAVMLYFMEGQGLESVLGTVIAFVLPGGAIMAYLLLTEQKRLKPWAMEEEEMLMELYTDKYQNPKLAYQRRLLSGALWITTLAIFFAIGLAFSFKFAWIVFLLAITFEILIELWLQRTPKQSEHD